MRSAAVLVSTLIVILSLCAVIPYAADEGSGAVAYVGDDTISICGYAKYDVNTDVVPEIIVFVVYTDSTGTNYYPDAKGDGLLMRSTITGIVSADESKNYYFEVTDVPLIDSGAKYYICAFNNFRISTVSSMIVADSRTTIVPDESWGTVVAQSWEAWEIDSSVWSGAAADDKVFVTGEYNESTQQMSGDLISLERATGAVTGHVDGSIAGNVNKLSDVLVQFIRDGSTVAETRTDNSGNYSIAAVPTGYYKVHFSRGNYECDPVTVTVNEGTNTVSSVTMTLKVSTDFFGYDLAHFLTIMGGAACAIIIVISIGYQWRRIKQKKSGKDWILDDMTEMDKDDEEDEKD